MSHQPQQIYKPMYYHNENVNAHVHQPFVSQHQSTHQQYNQQHNHMYTNMFNSNNNVNNHSHYGFTNIASDQQGQTSYNYETSYISSECNQHSHIGVQINNSQQSHGQYQLQQPSKFVTTYYQSDCNNHHIGNNYNNYNQSQPMYSHNSSYNNNIGSEFVINTAGLNTQNCHIGNVFNNIYICESPRKKRKLNNEINSQLNDELNDTSNSNGLINDTLSNEIISVEKRNELIDTMMPELMLNENYWIGHFKNKNVEIKAGKKYVKPKYKNRKKKSTKIILDCHVLCTRSYNENKKTIKSYGCLCGQLFTVTPPKIDPQTGKTKYTNHASGELNRHMKYHLRTYFGLHPNDNKKKTKK